MRRTKFGKLLCLLLALCLGFALVACGTDPEDTGDLTKGRIVLTPETQTIQVGMPGGITATLINIDGEVSWTSSNDGVATVTASGEGIQSRVAGVMGVAEGTATITASAGGKTATCTVTVTANTILPGIETVTIKYNNAAVGTDAYSVNAGGSITFSATASNNSAITWESSAPAVATVSNGVVTGVAAGEAVITAKVSDTVKATVKVKVVGEATDVAFSGENEAAFVSGWRYWSGEGNAEIISCTTYEQSNETTIKYTMSQGVFYSVQLFYKDKLTGVDHGVSLTVVSPLETNITLNGAKQELHEGENQVTVEHFSGSTLAVQFGVYDENTVLGENIEFTFKNLVVTSHAVGELKAPSFTYAASTKVITITDSENDTAKVQKYELGLFANADDEAPAYKVDVVSGSAIALDTVPSGNYVAKIRALGVANVINSGWSELTETIAWTNDKTPLDYKANDDIAAGSSTWYVWYQNWDPKTTVAEAYMQNGNIYLKGIANNGEYCWSVQLFYKGAAYSKLSFKVTASQAGKITVNGVVFELEAGVEKDIEVTTGSPNVSIQLGDNPSESNASNINGDITFSNITFE